MKRPQNHKPELSALNVLLCLLVIFIHVSSAPVTALYKDSWQYIAVLIPWRLSVFVVQGFLFLSGLKLFLNSRGEIRYKRFYLSRFIKIVVPYILWNVLYDLYFIHEGYFAFSWRSLGFSLISGTLVSPFYFIVVLVQFYALAPLWRWIVLKVPPRLALGFAVLITLVLEQFLPDIITAISPKTHFPYTDRVLTTYVFYWLSGCYAGLYYEKVTSFIKRHFILIAAVFAAVSLLEAVFSVFAFSKARNIIWLEDWHFLYCSAAILFFWTLLSRFYTHRKIANPLLNAVNAASYDIFLMHCLIIFIVNDVMAQLGITGIAMTYLIRIAAVYVITICLSILWGRLKGRIIKRLSSLRSRRTLPAK
ncbi:acyltransferase [Oscillospiraceae bacterium WX1]